MVRYPPQASSRIRQRLADQIRDYFGLGKALLQIRGPLRMGWLHVRYTSCRKGNCKCTRGQKHGPFLYASIPVRGKTVQRYVGKSADAFLVREIKNYQDFREKLARFRKHHREVDAGWIRLERSLTRRSVK